jgi:polar amino acid transport system substrate-binding protein
MPRPPFPCCVAAAAVTLLTGPASAGEPLRFAATAFPPVTEMAQDGTLTGPGPEALRQIARRMGLDAEPMALPINRLMEIALKEPNVIVTLSRSPEREARFQWISCGGQDRSVVVSLAGRPFLRIEDIPLDQPLATVLGSTQDHVIRRSGFTNIVHVHTDEQGLELLIAGRVAGWLTYRGVASLLLRKTKRSPGSVAMSESLGVTRFYTATGPATPAATIEAVRAAEESLRADGSRQRLLDSYAGLIEPCDAEAAAGP